MTVARGPSFATVVGMPGLRGAPLVAGAAAAALAGAPAASAQDLSQPGPRTPAQRDVTVVRANGSSFTATVHYPAIAAQAGAPVDAANGPYPIIAFGHGFVTPVTQYASTGAHLASWGFVVLLPQTQGSLFPSHAAFAADLRSSLDWMAAEGGVSGSPWAGAVDGSRRGVMGHSMGGRVALQLALEHPDLVRALVLVNASGLHLPHAPARSPRDLGPEGFIRALYHRPSARSLEAAVRDAGRWWPTLERLTRVPLRQDWHERLGEIRVPTLIIWGTEDGLIPWEHARAFQDGIPGARLHAIPDAGHVPMLERPGEVNRALAAFLDDLAPPSVPQGETT